MSKQVNPHYERIFNNQKAKNDSPIEIGELVSFNSETLTAVVLGLRTKEERRNVTVTFPGMFMNAGIFFFPVPGTKGLMYVGPENQSYFLPNQFHLPLMDVNSGMVSFDANPKRLNHLIDLDTFSAGEILLASLNDARVMILNDGNVEMATTAGHTMILDNSDGHFKTLCEGKDDMIAHSRFFNGSKKDEEGFNYHTIEEEVIPEALEWESNEAITLSGALQTIKSGQPPVDPPTRSGLKVKKKVITVLKNNRVQQHKEDGYRMYSSEEMETLDTYVKKEVSYAGASTYENETPTHLKEVTKSASGTHFKIANRLTLESLTIKKTPNLVQTDIEAPGEKITIKKTRSRYTMDITSSLGDAQFTLGANEVRLKAKNMSFWMKDDEATWSTPNANISLAGNDIHFMTPNGGITLSEIIAHIQNGGQA